MLWPESSEDVVRARLRRLLHRLQGVLGDDVLATDRSTVRWSPAIDLQVASQLFEQACDRGEFERACRLYAGDFLAGFSPGDCPQFDEWAFFRREALRGRAIQALERMALPLEAIIPRYRFAQLDYVLDPTDLHPNARAHRLIAEFILREIKRDQQETKGHSK